MNVDCRKLMLIFNSVILLLSLKAQTTQSIIFEGFDFIELKEIEGDTTEYHFELEYDSLDRVKKIRRFDKVHSLFNIEFGVIEYDSIFLRAYVILYGFNNINKSSPVKGQVLLDIQDKRLFFIATKYIPEVLQHPSSKSSSQKNSIMAIFELDNHLFPIAKLDVYQEGVYKTTYKYNKDGSLLKELLYLTPMNSIVLKDQNSFDFIKKNLSINMFQVPLASLIPKRRNIDVPLWLIYPYFYE